MTMEDLGGEFLSELSAVSWGQPRLDIFVRAPDNSIWHKWHDIYGWGDWESWGGNFPGNPVAVSWGPGRLDVFVRGWDNALMHTWYDRSHGPHPWEPLGGSFVSDPHVVSRAPGVLDVIVRGTDNALQHKSYDIRGWHPTSGPWVNLGGDFLSEPTVASSGPGRLDVFFRGRDNFVYHKWFDEFVWQPAGPGLRRLGMNVNSDPFAVFVPYAYNLNGGLHVLGRASRDNSLLDYYYTNRWYLSELGGNDFLGTPNAVSWGPGRLDAFVRGTDNTLRHWWFLYSGGWLPTRNVNWEELGDDIHSEPRAVAWRDGRLDAFVRGGANSLMWKWYDRRWQP
jgi:hypothetical protein